MKNMINKYFKESGFEISEQQINLFYQYAELLFAENKKVNLTALSGPEETVVKHFLDSIMVLKYRKLDKKKAIDLGTGAGFPGIPLKIMANRLEITLVDSLKKRCLFLEKALNHLGLSGVDVVNDRAENLGQNNLYRDSYDFSLSRAVAHTRILLEFHAPLLKIGGEIILLKGPGVEEELNASQKAADELGVELTDLIKYELPAGYGQRTLAVFKKTTKTPGKYPRRPGIPEKKPL